MSQDGDAQESGSSVDDKSVSSNDVKSEIVDETAKTSAGKWFLDIFLHIWKVRWRPDSLIYSLVRSL
jgi:hypothetical protein